MTVGGQRVNESVGIDRYKFYTASSGNPMKGYIICHMMKYVFLKYQLYLLKDTGEYHEQLLHTTPHAAVLPVHILMNTFFCTIK